MSDSNPSTPERFPDLYALLGLEPLELDRANIEQALKRLASQIQAGAKAADATQRQRLERAHKLFELGKQQLLDPQRKLRYDQQWRALYGQSVAKEETTANIRAVWKKQSNAANSPAKGAEQSPGWDLRELRSLLPNGDPHEPFRENEFVASGTTDLKTRYADNFAKLQSLLVATPVKDTVADAAATVVAATVVAATVVADSGVGEEEPASSVQDSSHPSGLRREEATSTKRTAGGRRPVPSIAGRLRKKQERGLLWGAIGALSAVGIVLGVAYWLMQSSPESTLASRPADLPQANPDPANSLLPTADPAPANDRPRRSGLPSVPGIDSTIAVPGMPAPSDSIPDMSSSPPTTDMASENNVTVPELVTLSAVEREQWSSAMLTARSTIGQQQYAEATQQLDDARTLVKTSPQTEQLARLVTVEQLAQEFSKALQSALAGMGAAESFIVGQSTPASFVGASEDRVSLRINGQSQSWSMTELPIGVAFAIADMTMDREHPRSLAAKAAFTLVHPAAQGKDMLTQRALQMMSAAIEAGAVSVDMAQVFTDDYTLPSE